MICFICNLKFYITFNMICLEGENIENVRRMLKRIYSSGKGVDE